MHDNVAFEWYACEMRMNEMSSGGSEQFESGTFAPLVAQISALTLTHLSVGRGG